MYWRGVTRLAIRFAAARQQRLYGELSVPGSTGGESAGGLFAMRKRDGQREQRPRPMSWGFHRDGRPRSGPVSGGLTVVRSYPSQIRVVRMADCSS